MATRLVVEWTRSTIRVAVAEGKGTSWSLRAVLSQPASTVAEATEALRTLLQPVKQAARAHVIVVLPREQVISRAVKFPTTKPDELAQMVELYTKAQLPYPKDQAVSDFHLIGQEGGFSQVGVMACHQEAVGRYLTVLREAGLSVSLLTVSSWGVLGWYQLLRARAGKSAKTAAGKVPVPSLPDEPHLVVNVDDTRTDLVLVGEGKILSSRSVAQGLVDWEPQGAALELLAQEVERSRAAVRKELTGIDLRSLIVTGRNVSAPWVEQLGGRVGLPMVAVDPQLALTFASAPDALTVSPVVIGGLACGDLRGALNLNPPELRVQVRHRQQVRQLMTVGILVVAVLGLGSALAGVEMMRTRRLEAEVSSLVRQIEPTAKALREKARVSQVVLSVLEDRERFTATFAGVMTATPADIELEAVTYEQNRMEFVVRGRAPATQTVLDYAERLQQLENVESVRLKYSTRRRTPTGERTNFELIITQRTAPS